MESLGFVPHAVALLLFWSLSGCGGSEMPSQPPQAQSEARKPEPEIEKAAGEPEAQEPPPQAEAVAEPKPEPVAQPPRPRDFIRKFNELLKQREVGDAVDHAERYREFLGDEESDKLRRRAVHAAIEMLKETWHALHRAVYLRTPDEAAAPIADFARRVQSLPEFAADLRGLHESLKAAGSPPKPLEPLWRATQRQGNYPKVQFFGAALPVGDIVVCPTRTRAHGKPDRYFLTAYRRSDGEVAWNEEVGTGDERPGFFDTLAPAGDGLVHAVGTTLVARDGASGTPQWKRALGAPAKMLLSDKGTLFVVMRAGGIEALDASSGSVRWAWKSATQAPLVARPARDGLYVVTAEGLTDRGDEIDGTYRVLRLAPDSGEAEILFEREARGANVPAWQWTAPLVVGRRVFLGVWNYEEPDTTRVRALAIDADAGGLLWETLLAQGREIEPRRVAVHAAFLHAERVHFAYTIYQLRAKPRWRALLAAFDPQADGTPVVRRELACVHDVGTVQVGRGCLFLAGGGFLSACDLDTAAVEWRRAVSTTHVSLEGGQLYCSHAEDRGRLKILEAFGPDRTPPGISHREPSCGWGRDARPFAQVLVKEAGTSAAPRTRSNSSEVTWDNILHASIQTFIGGKEVPHSLSPRNGLLGLGPAAMAFANGMTVPYTVVLEDRAGNQARFKGEVGVDLKKPVVRLVKPRLDRYSGNHMAFEFIVSDPVPGSGIDAKSIRPACGCPSFEKVTYDAETGSVTGYIRHWEIGPEEGPPEAEHGISLHVADRSGHFVQPRWEVMISPAYTSLLENLNRLDKLKLPEAGDQKEEQPYDTSAIRGYVGEMVPSDQNLEVIRRLTEVAEVLREGFEVQEELSADYAKAFFEIVNTAFSTTRALERHIEDLEGKEREDAEKEKRRLTEIPREFCADIEAAVTEGRSMVDDLRGEIGETVHSVVPMIDRDFLGVDPRAQERAWSARLARVLLKEHVEATLPIWEGTVAAAQGGGPWRALDEVHALLERKLAAMKKRAREAHAEWRKHYIEARNEAAKTSLTSMMAGLFVEGFVAGQAVQHAVELVIRAKSVKHYKQAVLAVAPAYEEMRLRVCAMAEAPFAKP